MGHPLKIRFTAARIGGILVCLCLAIFKLGVRLGSCTQIRTILFSKLFRSMNRLFFFSALINPFVFPFAICSFLHPDKQRRPDCHYFTLASAYLRVKNVKLTSDASRDHRPHASRKVGCEICSVEDDAPPRVDRVVTHIHGGNDHSSQTVFFVAQNVVCPGEECRLACVHASGPVIHCEVDRCIIWVSEDESGGHDTCDPDPVTHYALLAFCQL